MYGRYASNIKKNFTPDYQLSPLITGCFSPEYDVVLREPKSVQKSRVKVSLTRTSETYQKDWTGTNWKGHNYLNQTDSDWNSSAVFLFDIDWQNHTVQFVV
jgi:N-methylhydantoinase B/oxoprolinase/acetone carboxylase alpha subunit